MHSSTEPARGSAGSKSQASRSQASIPAQSCCPLAVSRHQEEEGTCPGEGCSTSVLVLRTTAAQLHHSRAENSMSSTQAMVWPLLPSTQYLKHLLGLLTAKEQTPEWQAPKAISHPAHTALRSAHPYSWLWWEMNIHSSGHIRLQPTLHC